MKATSAALEPSLVVPFQVADLSLLASRTGLGLTTSHAPGLEELQLIILFFFQR